MINHLHVRTHHINIDSFFPDTGRLKCFVLIRICRSYPLVVTVGVPVPPIIVDAPQQKRLGNSVLMWSRLNMRFPSIYFGPATAPPFFIVYRSMVLLVSISTCLIIIPNLWQNLLPDSEQSFCFLHFPLLFGLVIHTWEVVNHFCFINHHTPILLASKVAALRQPQTTSTSEFMHFPPYSLSYALVPHYISIQSVLHPAPAFVHLDVQIFLHPE